MHLVLFLMPKAALKYPSVRFGEAETTSGSFLLFTPDHGPALQLRDRLAFLDPHLVARLELVVLVVRVVIFRAANRLLVDRMGEAAIDPHHHGLGLLVADDDTLKRTFWHVGPLLLGVALLRGDGLV